MPDTPGEHRVATALREALPTRVHAQMFFELLVSELGDSALVQSWGEGKRRVLFRRESAGASAVYPWRVAEFRAVAPVILHDFFGPEFGPPVEIPVRPGRAPKLRNLGPGTVTLFDGASSLAVGYAEDGRWMETSRHGTSETLSGLLAAIASKSAAPAELVAAHLAALDMARHGPGRLHVPAPIAATLDGVWSTGRRALGDALFLDRIPWTARWAAADCASGTVIATGATRDEALAAWLTRVRRAWPLPRGGASRQAVIPSPGGPRTAVDELPTWSPEPGADEAWRGEDAGRHAPPVIQGDGGSSAPDFEVPEPTPETAPAALVPLAPRPAARPLAGEWVRLLCGSGEVCVAALRRDDDGFTILGDHLLAAIGRAELEEIDDEIAVADIDRPRFDMRSVERPYGMPPPPAWDCEVGCWEVLDPATRARIPPRHTDGSKGVGFRPSGLDVDTHRWSVVRVRWI